ncbi:MAG TPA: 2-oxoglutarate dehydrogenase E1 component [Gemmatimonadaceae bacterium]|nr:2-oxoglutarate dehydrogenase E1 component [Gemmatimonadaceae bacterium]
MPSAPITSVYNDGYIAEIYEAYRRDPASVDESWRQFFRFAEQLGGADKSATTVAADPVYLRKVAGAAALVDAIRQYGHLAVQLDPLGSPPPGAAELTPEFHGITASDLQLVPALALGFDVGTGADVTSRLRDLYSSTMGFEFAHLGEEAEREWFRETIEHERLARYLTPEEKRNVLRRLSEVDGLERFIGRAWVNMKRFSIEGTDALVPMLDVLIEDAGHAGTRDVVIAMAHRGRINVLTHILGKSYATVFGEFDGRHAAASAESETGDVKYHLGARTERTLADGRTVGVQLVPNPSHLEVVNPVVTGLARALQRVTLGERLTGEFDSTTVTPVIVHGDAAFPGEGIVAESLNLSRLRGYTVGGSLHIIVNNQVGFTTDPTDARSTHYASDLAKGFEIPIVHVNADDLEACIAAVRLGVAYRTKFNKDFLIDLVGYRRHGHNEGDEPTFTQPTLYATIKAHPTPRQVWGERLVREGVVTAEDVQAAEREVAKELEEIYDESKKVKTEEFEIEHSKAAPTLVETAVRAEQLVALNEQLLAWPTGFSAHPRLAKQLERRRDAMGEEGGIDWGHAESLAFASLLADGTSVRMSGQDAERGTFSHRHAVLHDPSTGQTFTPLQHLPNARGQLEIYNSPLSETGVLGFEYGYSTAADDTLVLWEAQFGDFVNVAQPIIDQFIAADRAKWAQDSGVVMLLPHGYEGQGPEHSSARLERFLQLCADGNLTVAYPSTPAQYFHILRRQAKSDSRRPLILMQPKSLLRLPQAASRLNDLVNGRFASVIDDPTTGDRREDVQRVVFCTGKLFYDLNAKERPANVAIARIEELYPWPSEQVIRILDLYRNVTEVVWAQEEPKNMGAWTYVWPRLRACTGNAMLIRYIGRPERASPAEGYVASHQEEQARIVTEALEVPTRRKTAARS